MQDVLHLYIDAHLDGLLYVYAVLFDVLDWKLRQISCFDELRWQIYTDLNRICDSERQCYLKDDIQCNIYALANYVPVILFVYIVPLPGNWDEYCPTKAC